MGFWDWARDTGRFISGSLGAAPYNAYRLGRGLVTGDDEELESLGRGWAGTAAVGGGLALGGAAGAGVGGLGMGSLPSILGLGSAALSAYDAHRQGSQADGYIDALRRIALEQEARSNEMFESRRPIREAGQEALLGQLQRGRRTPPDLGGFADTANPFRARFPRPGGVGG